MSFQVLSQAGALGAGSQVWILPELTRSAWARRVDWYLNLQLTRASQHKPIPLGEDLREMAEVGLVEPPELELPAPCPLMVGCSKSLPANQVLVMPGSEDFTAWVSAIHDLWQRLLRPQLRVFLPSEQSAADWQNLWPKNDRMVEVSLVATPPPAAQGKQ